MPDDTRIITTPVEVDGEIVEVEVRIPIKQTPRAAPRIVSRPSSRPVALRHTSVCDTCGKTWKSDQEYTRCKSCVNALRPMKTEAELEAARAVERKHKQELDKQEATRKNRRWVNEEEEDTMELLRSKNSMKQKNRIGRRD